MLQWIKRRLRCSMITNTYNRRKVAVTATKKSQAMISRACRRKKVDQRKSSLGRPRGGRGRYLFTVRGDTRIPSFNSNSLAMRSSPQEGFSFAIRRISACNSQGIGGRPGRDFSRQNSFHPARCQRINVCGRTTTKASRQSKNPDRIVSAMRVTESIRRGLTPRSTYSAN